MGKKFNSVILAGMILVFFGGCSKDAKNEAPHKPPTKSAPQFRYDESTHSCNGHYTDREEPGECVQISGQSLKSARLSGKNLKGARFISVDLSFADLSESDLSGAYFLSTDLTGANLEHVFAPHAELSDVNLERANLKKVTLDPANMERITLDEAHLQGAILSTPEAAHLKQDPETRLRRIRGAKIDGDTLLGRGDFSHSFVLAHGIQFESPNAVDLPQLNRTFGSRMTLGNNLSPYLTGKFFHDIYGFTSRYLLTSEEDEFQKVFAGASMNQVSQFLFKRIDHVAWEQEDEGVLAANSTYEHLAKLLNKMRTRLLGNLELQERWVTHGGSRPSLLPLPNLELLLNGEMASVMNPPVQKIQLQGYSNLNRSTVNRMNTLVHEARHSDCEPLKGEDLKNVLRKQQSIDLLLAGLSGTAADWNSTHTKLLDEVTAFANSFKKLKNALENPLCGFKHVTCPQNHPDLPGVPGACDQTIPRGAYFVAAIFSKALALKCSNCSELEKSLARAAAVDAFNRVLDLSSYYQSGLSGVQY